MQTGIREVSFYLASFFFLVFHALPNLRASSPTGKDTAKPNFRWMEIRPLWWSQKSLRWESHGSGGHGFPTYHTEIDEMLLKDGYHIAYINAGSKLGSIHALKIWEQFYDLLTQEAWL